MRFGILGEVEICGIQQIVENNVMLVRGPTGIKKEKRGTTVVWKRYSQGGILRWLKFYRPFVDNLDTVVGGKSEDEMHCYIERCMLESDEDEVWFNGESCNINHILNYKQMNRE